MQAWETTPAQCQVFRVPRLLHLETQSERYRESIPGPE
jgi:hypothetical protein